MRLIVGVALLALALGSCGRGDQAAENAEREYNLVSTTGSSAEKCKAAGKATDEWLKRQDKAKYDDWRITRDYDCIAPN